MKTKSIQDWDDAFANMAYIPGSEDLPDRWTARAAAYRDSGVRIELDLPYGKHPRERFDMVWPGGAPKGLVVFVHGGYWMRLDKSYWTDLAEGARARGWAVCLPSYTLAPEARIAHMTRQIGQAITVAAGQVAGPIRLSGHSAGGHLVSRMICDDTPLAADVLARVAHTMSISGLHDLRPLMWTGMNDTLHLDAAEASAESAVLHWPAGNPCLTTWVGGGERPEFIRQTQILAQLWQGLDADTRCVVDGTHDHFTVIEGLNNPESDIIRGFLQI
ncbi:alpha/beta hydrolase [Rhodophyticola sp. CCM32]|uniref:alpha/beta hydrolase n=1 Tax=Rhodophyticola sp. CCM32 TaxID=2916397 RepID=UPI00107F2ABE|nr:alpha/beta hydrolase [Rhodophyticola sp. CCM32]QBY01276.1 alpha/beta hydrolase [Rhodophyticola sp. CCM32]